MAFDHLREDLIVDKARRSGTRTERILRTIRDDVVAEFAVRALDRAVAFADGRVEAAVVHVQLEQLDHAFDRAVHVGLLGNAHLAVGDRIDRSAGKSIDELIDDLRRLLDFLEAHEVARKAAARAGDGDRELDLVRAFAVPVVGVAEIGVVLANIATNTRAARVRARKAPRDGVFLRHRANAVEAINEDAVAVTERFEIGDRLRQTNVDEVAHHALEDFIVGDVAPCAADARPIGVVALARDILDDVVDEFALVEAVEEARERPEVERSRANAEEVVLDATEFAHDRADNLRARREFDAEQLLDRVVPRDVVHDRRDVIHTADRADVLVVVVMLAELLEARVQVADVRRTAGDTLAVEFKHKAQSRVRRGVLRAEVENPTVWGLEVILQVVRVLDVETKALRGRDRVWHRGRSIGPTARLEVRRNVVRTRFVAACKIRVRSGEGTGSFAARHRWWLRVRGQDGRAFRRATASELHAANASWPPRRSLESRGVRWNLRKSCRQRSPPPLPGTTA